MTLILSGTDGVSDIDGSAATPAIRGTDTNTGIFFPAADTMAFSEGGVEAMRIDSSGNVGIGTTSPSSALNVYRSTDAFVFVDSDTASAIRSSIYNSSTNASGLQMAKYRGTLASPTAVNSADGVGQLNYLAYGGTNIRSIARIDGFVDTYTSDTNISGNLRFLTNGGSTTPTERMRIDSSGNVGIGVTNNLTAKLNFDGTDRGETINIYTASSEASRSGIGKYASETRYYAATNDIFAWRTGGPSGTERMRIDSSGNLLVGTTSALSVGTRLNVENSGSSYVVASFKGAVNSNISVLRLERYASDGDAITFYYGSTQKGYISVLSTGTQYGTLSDYRLKENVQPMVGALAKVSALKPVTYDWKDIGKTGQGFIAHELKAIVPECVTGEKDELDDDGNPRYQGIDTSFLVATLTAAIQEQQALIQSLTARITALETP